MRFTAIVTRVCNRINIIYANGVLSFTCPDSKTFCYQCNIRKEKDLRMGIYLGLRNYDFWQHTAKEPCGYEVIPLNVQDALEDIVDNIYSDIFLEPYEEFMEAERIAADALGLPVTEFDVLD